MNNMKYISRCRQMVARSLLETIRSVGDNEDDANTVLKAMVKLAQDPGEMSYSNQKVSYGLDRIYEKHCDLETCKQ